MRVVRGSPTPTRTCCGADRGPGGRGWSLAGCGSSSSSSSSTTSQRGGDRARTTSPIGEPAPGPPPAVARACPPPSIRARRSSRRPAGKSLKDLGTLAKSSVELGAATGTFTPGTERYAFALTTGSGAFVYAPTALYVAIEPGRPGQGAVPGAGRSDERAPSVPQQAELRARRDPGDLRRQGARCPRPGPTSCCRSREGPSGLIGATGELAAAASSQIPPWASARPTSPPTRSRRVHGNQALLTTRLPPEHMAAASLQPGAGQEAHRAAVLHAAAVHLTRMRAGDRRRRPAPARSSATKVDFIHQEVYVDNQPSKGLRPQLKAFHLRTEPWLFAINTPGQDRRAARGRLRDHRADPGHPGRAAMSRARCAPGRSARGVAVAALAALLAGCGASSSGSSVTAPKVAPAADHAPGRFPAERARSTPGKPTTMSFDIKLPDGKTLTHYKTGPGPHTGVHLIIVRDDLGLHHPPAPADPAQRRPAPVGHLPGAGPLPRARGRLPRRPRRCCPTSSCPATSG